MKMFVFIAALFLVTDLAFCDGQSLPLENLDPDSREKIQQLMGGLLVSVWDLMVAMLMVMLQDWPALQMQALARCHLVLL